MKKILFVFSLCLLLYACKDCKTCSATKRFYHAGLYDSMQVTGFADYCGTDIQQIQSKDSFLIYPNIKDSTVYYYLTYKCIN